MDRTLAACRDDRALDRRQWGDEHVLPSRLEALARAQCLLGAGTGPLLLTGESGAGKTWLLKNLRSAMPERWRWVFVDLTPAVGPADVFRLILHELGIDSGPTLAEARLGLAGFLTDRSADGEFWALGVEETHIACVEVLEEVRVLGNRLGTPEGFAGLVISGQNTLIRRLSGRALAPLAARFSGHVHLQPISVEELREWIAQTSPGEEIDEEEVELLHRQTAGDPRSLCWRLGGRYRFDPATTAIPTPTVPRGSRPIAPLSHSEMGTVESRPIWKTPLVPTAKPPLEVREGMIEVGWDPDDEQEDGNDFEEETEPIASSFPQTTAGVLENTPTSLPFVPLIASEETIRDHYAALQAQAEWTRNHGRQPVEANPVGPLSLEEQDEFPESKAVDQDRTTPPPGVRAEVEHGFAPYGQLFTRLRQSHEPC